MEQARATTICFPHSGCDTLIPSHPFNVNICLPGRIFRVDTISRQHPLRGSRPLCPTFSSFLSSFLSRERRSAVGNISSSPGCPPSNPRKTITSSSSTVSPSASCRTPKRSLISPIAAPICSARIHQRPPLSDLTTCPTFFFCHGINILLIRHIALTTCDYRNIKDHR